MFLNEVRQGGTSQSSIQKVFRISCSKPVPWLAESLTAWISSGPAVAWKIHGTAPVTKLLGTTWSSTWATTSCPRVGSKLYSPMACSHLVPAMFGSFCFLYARSNIQAFCSSMGLSTLCWYVVLYWAYQPHVCPTQMRLKQDGIMVCAPPCSLYGPACSSIHQRTKQNPAGNLQNFKVRLARRIWVNFVAWHRFQIVSQTCRNQGSPANRFGRSKIHYTARAGLLESVSSWFL